MKINVRFDPESGLESLVEVTCEHMKLARNKECDHDHHFIWIPF